MHPVGGLLCFVGSGEDGAGVVFQDLKPRGDVGRVLGARSMSDAKVRRDEAAGQLTDDFVHGVFRGAEAAAEVAVEPVPGACGVRCLMSKARVVACGIDEALERRHEDRIDTGAVAGLVAAGDDRDLASDS